VSLPAEVVEQPLPFSQKTPTSTAKLVCKDCHASPAKFGDTPGLPATSKCMACHVAIAKDKPSIQKLAAFAKSNQPVPWLRLNKLPDFVFFDHRYHLANEATCQDCHGAVAEQDSLQGDIFTTKMPFCQGCHQKTGANARCNACHDR